jgi:Ca2+-binding EF-hand superfamily protein
MIKHSMLAVGVLSLVLAGAASAQQSQGQQSQGMSAQECQSMFKAADLNNDGKLTRDELASSQDLAEFYGPDENVTEVPLSKFLSDCAG